MSSWEVHRHKIEIKLHAMELGHYSFSCPACGGNGRIPNKIFRFISHRCSRCHGSRFILLESAKNIAEFIRIELDAICNELETCKNQEIIITENIIEWIRENEERK